MLNDKEMHLKVVSIVGFGGLGKTTLANEIYRQPDGVVECRAFVPVTQRHTIQKLIRSLLSELGSRVITTTRIHDVAKACCSHPRDYILEMKPLSDEDSRRLFFNRIFNSEEACPRQLRDISTEILRKCDGMPLAIITISGMLASERLDQQDWEHIRNSLGSGTNFTLKGMRKILDLSYKNLPPHLKTCLLYLGMYP
uniref:NB-ARC domain-containing protein n=2 Tax=Aegilops tauschii TaxID=37682 RepID=A0A453Q4V7_AEGTS